MVSELSFNILNYGVELIEIVIEFQLFVFFFLNIKYSPSPKAQPETKEIRGSLALGFALLCLFIAIARIFYVVNDVFLYSRTIRIIARIFLSLGIILFFACLRQFFFPLIFQSVKASNRYFLTILITLVILFPIYLYSPGYRTQIVVIPSIILIAPFLYNFFKWIRIQEGIISKCMSYFFFGMILMVFGEVDPWDFQPPLEKVFFTAGMIFVSFGALKLPSLNELDWSSQFMHVYIISAKSGIPLYCKSYNKYESQNTLPLSSGLTLITEIIKQMTASPEKIRAFQQNPNGVILMEYGNHILIALETRSDLKILHLKIQYLIEEIEFLYSDILPNLNLIDVEVFKPIQTLVDQTFLPKLLK